MLDYVKERRMQVLRLMADGYSDDQMAVALHYHVRTIKLDVKAIRQTLKATTRANIVSQAYQHGLLSVGEMPVTTVPMLLEKLAAELGYAVDIQPMDTKP